MPDTSVCANPLLLNWGSIAKVCATDSASVEQVYKEMIAQLKDHVKRGVNV